MNLGTFCFRVKKFHALINNPQARESIHKNRFQKLQQGLLRATTEMEEIRVPSRDATRDTLVRQGGESKTVDEKQKQIGNDLGRFP